MAASSGRSSPLPPVCPRWRRSTNATRALSPRRTRLIGSAQAPGRSRRVKGASAPVHMSASWSRKDASARETSLAPNAAHGPSLIAWTRRLGYALDRGNTVRVHTGIAPNPSAVGMRASAAPARWVRKSLNACLILPAARRPVLTSPSGSVRVPGSNARQRILAIAKTRDAAPRPALLVTRALSEGAHNAAQSPRSAWTPRTGFAPISGSTAPQTMTVVLTLSVALRRASCASASPMSTVPRSLSAALTRTPKRGAPVLIRTTGNVLARGRRARARMRTVR
mmetsp:Transcript_21465/g.59044  ORF Transcript_21465/g.59044 Transcript_21465/m.59044 type:complete len:281 (-) Transcript_21465:724-1566(-)